MLFQKAGKLELTALGYMQVLKLDGFMESLAAPYYREQLNMADHFGKLKRPQANGSFSSLSYPSFLLMQITAKLNRIFGLSLIVRLCIGAAGFARFFLAVSSCFSSLFQLLPIKRNA